MKIAIITGISTGIGRTSDISGKVFLLKKIRNPQGCEVW